MTPTLDTLFTGRNPISLRSVNSTNTYLAELQRTERLAEGTSVTAEFQEGGKGQYGHHWYSESGKNLLVSYLFYPTFLDNYRLHYLNMAFALAVSDALLQFVGTNVSIKWPNDIYSGDKKLAGLLIENTLGKDHLRQTILGIGINVNQINFPAELPNPASICLLSGLEYKPEDVFIALSNALERRYLQLRKGDYQGLRNDYHHRLFRHGKWEWFEASGKKFKGMIMGVNRDGQLMMQDETGHSMVYDMKQIRYVLEK